MAKAIVKRQTTEYYDIRKLLQYPASYYVVFGERSNGKTFSSRRTILELIYNDWKQGKRSKFLYMRRKHTHITKTKMIKLFEEDDEFIESLFGDFMHYSIENGFHISPNDIQQNMGYAIAVEDAFLTKGIPYHDVDYVLFDEILDIDYMDDELERFQHVISTVVRNRETVKIFCLGNTIRKSCPYFELFGINPNEIKQGQVGVVKHKGGVTVVVEYCKNRVVSIGDTVKTHKYLGFDNSETAKMILYGSWEYQTKNIKSIDNISWNNMRYIIPIYITFMQEVYEMSINTDNIPILFVRKVNTQKGMVSEKIQYHLSHDDTIPELRYNKGKRAVFKFKKFSKFMDEDTIGRVEIMKECLKCGRTIYSDFATGTEFERIMKEVLKP